MPFAPYSRAWLSQWLHRTLTDSTSVRNEATLESLRRLRIFAIFTVLANSAYVLYFWWWKTTTSPGAAATRHADAIIDIHAICGVGICALGVVMHVAYHQGQQRPLLARSIQVLLCAWGLLFGVALSVADQWMGNNTTNYAMLTLIVAMVALLHPLVAFALLGAAYALLYHALALTQHDPSLLSMARSHSLSGTLMAMVAAVVMWHQYVTAAVLRRQLTQSNAALEQQQQDLSYLATHDALTGLRNRRAFLQEAEHELQRALRYPCETSILVADLDHFKRVNDQYGHPGGDAVLRHFAALLKAQLRDSDIAARLGGEEFIVLLPGTGAAGAAAVGEKIRSAIEAAPVSFQDQSIEVTASLGVSSLLAGKSSSIEALYGQADQALYAAKASGRNRVVQAESEA